MEDRFGTLWLTQLLICLKACFASRLDFGIMKKTWNVILFLKALLIKEQMS